MSSGQLGIAALVLYLLGIAVVATLARRARADETPSDHVLAGRRLGVFVLFLTLYATAYSGNSLLGYPGEAYRRGFSFVMSVGFMMSIIVVFHALVPKLRPLAAREGFVTPGDWLRHRFGGERGAGALRVAIALLMIVALANFLVTQLIAMGLVTATITEGAVPFEAGVVGLALVILAYETLGGMRAVAWTDSAQGVLMLGGLTAVLVWLLGESGGLAATTEAVAALRPEAVRVPDAAERINWASTIALLGLGSVLYPQAIQRVYAAQSGRSLRRAMALMTFMPLTTTLVVTGIGIAAIPRIEALGGVEADRVMPLLLGEWAAAGPATALMAVLVMLGALAAIMSTADSVLLSLGSMVAGDLLGLERDAPRTTRIGKRVAALFLGVAVAVAIVPSFTIWRLIELKMELLVQGVPAFLLALHVRGLGAPSVLAGVLVGTAVTVVAFLAGVTRVGGVHVGLVGLALNALVVAAGTALVALRGASTPPAAAGGRSSQAGGGA